MTLTFKGYHDHAIKHLALNLGIDPQDKEELSNMIMTLVNREVDRNRRILEKARKSVPDTESEGR